MSDKLIGLIPAGGQGSRLYPHTIDKPKPLLPMGDDGQSLIDLPLMTLTSFCDKTAITTYQMGDAVEEYVSNKFDVEVLRDASVVGNAGALVEHWDYFSQFDVDSSLLIIPSDHVFKGLNIDEMHALHADSAADATILTTAPKNYGEFVQIEDGLVTRTLTRASKDAQSTTGIYIISIEVISHWVRCHLESSWDGRPLNITKDLVNQVIAEGNTRAYHLNENGYWDDAGTHERYHTNNMLLTNGRNVVDSEANVDNAQIERCVVIGSVILSSELRLSDAIVSGVGCDYYITQV